MFEGRYSIGFVFLIFLLLQVMSMIVSWALSDLNFPSHPCHMHVLFLCCLQPFSLVIHHVDVAVQGSAKTVTNPVKKETTSSTTDRLPALQQQPEIRSGIPTGKLKQKEARKDRCRDVIFQPGGTNNQEAGCHSSWRASKE
jgi:hypothetical protein